MNPEKILHELLQEMVGLTINKSTLLGGNVNHTFLVNSNQGEFIVKLMTREPVDEIEHHRFLKSKMIYDRLEELSIQSVNVLHADTEVREYKDFTIFGCLVLERVSGNHLSAIWKDWTDDKRKGFVISFAEFLKKIHQITFTSYGPIDPVGERGYNSWTEFIQKTAEGEITKLKKRKVFTDDFLDNALAFLDKNYEKIEYTKSPKLIHGDLWAGNIIIDPDSNIILLDWEWSLSGDPSYDLLWIEEVFGGDKSYVGQFMKYYGIDDQDLPIKLRCQGILASLNTCATGWVFHNPSEEGFARQKELIEQNILGVS